MAQKRGRTRLRRCANSPARSVPGIFQRAAAQGHAKDMSDAVRRHAQMAEQRDQVRVGRRIIDDEAHVHRHRAGAARHLDGMAVTARLRRGFIDRHLMGRVQQPGRRHPGDAGPYHRDPQPIRAPHVPRHPCYANRTTIRPPRWITAAVGDPMRPVLRKGGMYVSRQPWAVRAGTGLVSPRPGTDAMTDMPGETSHAALIHAVAADRDRAAFATLFGHFAPRVKTFLQRRGADAAQAEELAQEVMLTVWRKAGQFDPGRATAAAWIFAIARNLWIDALRRTRLCVPRPDPSDEPAPRNRRPMRCWLADHRARRLHAAIAASAAEQIESLRLAFFEERSHSEIEPRSACPSAP